MCRYLRRQPPSNMGSPNGSLPDLEGTGFRASTMDAKINEIYIQLPLFIQNAAMIENCVQTLAQTVAAQTTKITNIEQIVVSLVARVTSLEQNAASGSSSPDSARSCSMLGQSNGSTATGDDNRNTRRRLDTFSSPEDEHARSAVLLRVEAPCFRGVPFRWVLHFVLSLTRCLTLHDVTSCSRRILFLNVGANIITCQVDDSTAAGSHGPVSSSDNKNTRRRLDTLSSTEDEQSRSAVLLGFLCEQYHKGITKWINNLCEESNMPADSGPDTIHCKAGSMSVRLVSESRSKCQDFVARYKDDGIPYAINSPFCRTSTTITVRQSRSIEDREIGKQFAPLWKVLADQLKLLFSPDSVRSCSMLGQSNFFTATGSLGSHGPCRLMTVEIQGVDLILSQVLKMNLHEVPSYYGSRVNSTTLELRTGSIIFGKNPTCQQTINLLRFIARQVPCRPDLYLKQEPNVTTLWPDVKMMVSPMKWTVPFAAPKQLSWCANPNHLKTGRSESNLRLCGGCWPNSSKFSSLVG